MTPVDDVSDEASRERGSVPNVALKMAIDRRAADSKLVCNLLHSAAAGVVHRSAWSIRFPVILHVGHPCGTSSRSGETASGKCWCRYFANRQSTSHSKHFRQSSGSGQPSAEGCTRLCE